MNSLFTPQRSNRAGRACPGLAALLVAGAMLVPASAAAATSSGQYCLRQWPNDHNTYLLCQQLQNRNQLEFRQFLAQHDLSEKMLDQGRIPDKPAAKAAQYCRDRWAPDYQGIWSCIKRRTDKPD
ncbi:hypothetical protein ACS8YF_10015 [Salinisphaera sp. SWV1]|uniref:hypothetical protein n=1 Tax=Salinisphaera sp. SWV1 TaxID=3454139 RepID=UPI003F86F38A